MIISWLLSNKSLIAQNFVLGVNTPLTTSPQSKEAFIPKQLQRFIGDTSNPVPIPTEATIGTSIFYYNELANEIALNKNNGISIYNADTLELKYQVGFGSSAVYWVNYCSDTEKYWVLAGNDDGSTLPVLYIITNPSNGTYINTSKIGLNPLGAKRYTLVNGVNTLIKYTPRFMFLFNGYMYMGFSLQYLSYRIPCNSAVNNGSGAYSLSYNNYGAKLNNSLAIFIAQGGVLKVLKSDHTVLCQYTISYLSSPTAGYGSACGSTTFAVAGNGKISILSMDGTTINTINLDSTYSDSSVAAILQSIRFVNVLITYNTALESYLIIGEAGYVLISEKLEVYSPTYIQTSFSRVTDQIAYQPSSGLVYIAGTFNSGSVIKAINGVSPIYAASDDNFLSAGETVCITKSGAVVWASQAVGDDTTYIRFTPQEPIVSWTNKNTNLFGQSDFYRLGIINLSMKGMQLTSGSTAQLTRDILITTDTMQGKNVWSIDMKDVVSGNAKTAKVPMPNPFPFNSTTEITIVLEPNTELTIDLEYK